MVARSLLFALLAAVALWTSPHAASQEEVPEDSSILLILDSSGSMAGDDGTGTPKIVAAKDALRGLIDELPPGSQVGLRVYGHRVPNTDRARGCRDTELIVPVGPLDRAAMKSRIRGYGARGFTPIGLSLREGAEDLPATETRTIILVSDGEDTCAPPDPCQVARGLATRGIGLQIETVGFQVDARARRQLQCIAQVSGGSYTDAPNAEELARSLEEISLRALRLYETVGTLVQGGASAPVAPVIAGGQYVDTISPQESLWYGIELAEGQSVAASATMVVQGDRAGLASTAALRMEIYNPAQEEDVFVDQIAFGVGVETETVTTESETVGSDADLYAEPGTYYVAVSLVDPSGNLPQSEYPVELVVQVQGETTTPTTSPGSPAPGKLGQAAGLPQRGRGEEGTPLWTWIVVGMLGAVAGAVTGGLVAVRLVRRR